MKNKFIIPLLFEGAPCPAVMLQGEIRIVTNPDEPTYGKVRIYTDSMYAPLANKGYVSYGEAVELIESQKAIWVKENFDQYDINDLKEIKAHLPTKWIDAYNDYLRNA